MAIMASFRHKIIFSFLLITILFSCKSSCNIITSSKYKNIEPYLIDYVGLSYISSYIEDYDTFAVTIDSIKKDYFLITIHPYNNGVMLNSSDVEGSEWFPQYYKDIKEETFFIDFQYKKTSKEVYNKLLDKNRIDSTNIWIEQGDFNGDYPINTYDDSIYSQNYLVKQNKDSLELIYKWFGN